MEWVDAWLWTCASSPQTLGDTLTVCHVIFVSVLISAMVQHRGAVQSLIHAPRHGLSNRMSQPILVDEIALIMCMQNKFCVHHHQRAFVGNPHPVHHGAIDSVPHIIRYLSDAGRARAHAKKDLQKCAIARFFQAKLRST